MSDTQAARSRERPVGELIVDIVIVVGSGLYLWVAQSYPKDGRQIPTVVSVIALGVGLLQLVGWFVPRMWTLTHGSPPAEPTVAEQPAPAADRPAETQPAETEPVETQPAEIKLAAQPATRQQNRDTAIIIAWAAGFLAAILVLGYQYGVPLFFLAYFGWRRQWKLAAGSAVVMWAVTQFVFIDVLSVHLPASQFFAF